MKTDQFDYIIWVVIGILIAVIAGLVIGSNLVGIQVETAMSQNETEVGMMGPISLQFSQPMDRESVEAMFSLSSGESGTFIWSDKIMKFYPNNPLEIGETYTAKLSPGSLGEDNRRVKDEYSWTFTVREPWIATLTFSDFGREIFRVPLSGGEPEQLTNTDGLIFDYSPSPDGEHIAYSLVNDEEGMDIWIMDRDGNSPVMEIDCGIHRCTTPAWSPYSEKIAYSRADAGLGPNEPFSAPRIWLYDFDSKTTARLFANTQKIGYGPNWSPDGTKLAYKDGINNQIVVVALESGSEFLISSQMGNTGSWSPDGYKILFGDILWEANTFSEVIYQIDLLTENITPLYGNLPNDSSYNNPLWSPDGVWIVVNTRPPDSPTNRRLEVMSAGNKFGFIIADDPNYTYLNYKFDPSTRYLVYQQLELGVAFSQPQVILYDLTNGSTILLAENASFPTWLP